MNDDDLALAIDLGGTRFRVALVDRHGHTAHRSSWPTQAESGWQSVVRRLAEAARQTLDLAGGRQVLGLGVGAPGPLDPWLGVVWSAPNLPDWHNVPLRNLLQQQLGLPVFVNNDANLAALGEWRWGAGRGLSDLVYLTVSTGIGGGVIAAGRLLLGAHGLAAELGHTIVVPEGPLCGCGNHGCLEALASGTAIARQGRERLVAGEHSLLRELADGRPEEISAELVVSAARAGDNLARAVLDQAMEFLGLGIVNFIHAFDPQRVIIGGGVSQAGELLFAPVRRTIAERAMPAYRRGVEVVPAALGDDSGLLGAGALVFDELRA